MKEKIAEILNKPAQQIKMLYKNQLLNISQNKQLTNYRLKDGDKIMIFISEGPKTMEQVKEERITRSKSQAQEQQENDSYPQKSETSDHESQILLNIWDKLNVTPELLKDKIKNSPVLQYLASTNEAFDDFIKSEQVVQYLYQLLINKEVVAKLISQKDSLKSKLKKQAEKSSSSFMHDYKDFLLISQAGTEVSTEYEGDQLQLLQQFKSEIEQERPQQFEYEEELKMLINLNIDVDQSIIKQLLLFFDGNIELVLDELYKLD